MGPERVLKNGKHFFHIVPIYRVMVLTIEKCENNSPILEFREKFYSRLQKILDYIIKTALKQNIRGHDNIEMST